MTEDPHKVIREVFQPYDVKDNLPRLLRRGGRDDLGTVTQRLGYRNGAEIGTKRGAFAEILCKGNPDLHLWCVDPWLAYNNLKQGYQDKVHKNALQRLAKYNVTIIEKMSTDAVTQFKDASLDFVYIDANHRFDYVMMDLLIWHPKVRSGGMVALHDYRAGYLSGVVEAVDAYTRCHDIRPWYVTREREPTALWIVE